MRSLTERLSAQIPAQSLAMFRILLGALVLVDVWRFHQHDRIWRYWIGPDFHFSYPGFHWLPRLEEPWVQIAWAALGVAALLVTIGLFYRTAIVAMTLLFGYFFLFDAAEYLNHFYLLLLYAIILCFLPAANIWSLDARLRGKGRDSVPHAAVFILRLQTEIMLIYAGLVKLTPDWLAGEPLGLWLRDQAEGAWFQPLVMQDWVIIAACWGVIALHVLGAPLLLWHRTRLAIFLVYCVFHTANSFFFNIGIFPWLTIAASTIFFAPDWPGQLVARLRRQSPPAIQHPGARPLPRLALVALAVWIAVQIILPIRTVFFPSELRWSGEGHRFSWRMRIYDREARGHFIVTDRDSGQQWHVDPVHFLTPRQADKMMVRADLLHQFAQYLGALWQAEGRNVTVRAEICKSLNGRPCQHFIDPETDLLSVESRAVRHASWILPLEVPVWGVRDNRHLYRQAQSGPGP